MDEELLGPIGRDEMFARSTGYSPTTGRSGYFILTRTDFGWHPSAVPLPFSYPADYYLIPLNQVERVEFDSNAMPTGQSVQIEYHEEGGEKKAFEFHMRAGPAYLWLEALRGLQVEVRGGDAVDPGTRRGFLNNYGLLILFFPIMLPIALAFLYAGQAGPRWGLLALLLLPPIWYASILLVGRLIGWWNNQPPK